MSIPSSAYHRNSRTTSAPDRFTIINGRMETIALKYPTGKRVQSRFGGEQIMYTLADGRRAYFGQEVAQAIDALHLAPGQPFLICKHGPGEWDVQYAQQQPPAQARPTHAWSGSTHAPAQPTHAQPSRVNGAGEDVAAILGRMYPPAIEIALGAVDAARAKGLMISPTFEDIRAIATTLLISETGGRR